MSISSIFHKMYNRRKWAFLAKLKGEVLDRPKFAAVVNSSTLTSEQEAEIQDYFVKNWGRKIDTRWHRYYTKVSGHFCSSFVPENIYTVIEDKMNRRDWVTVFSDKLTQYAFFKTFGFINTPSVTAYIKNGQWFDSNRNPVTTEECAELVKGKKLFGKPVANSCSGAGCEIVDFDMKTDDIISALSKYKDNYMFQNIIINNDEIKALHPYSLNTFRIMTYISDGKVYHCSPAMRMGRNKNHVDNAHSGGLLIGVEENGDLMKFTFTEYNERVYEHPDTGIVFDGYHISGMDKMIHAVETLHYALPEIGIISWDVTLDDEDRVTLIEMNLSNQSPWIPQMASGKSLFGDNTEKMLKKYSLRN